MPYLLYQGDITQLEVDGIVNAANRDLRMGGGVCGAIFRGAGEMDMQRACIPLAPVQTGDAVITPAFNLPCSHVIHTVGPIWEGGKKNEKALLTSCYRNALELAFNKGMHSIAFPLISAGIYGYPKDEAYAIATSTILSFIKQHDLLVYLVLFETGLFKDEILHKHKLAEYITKQQVSVSLVSNQVMRSESPLFALEGIVTEVDESFSQTLMRLISEKGLDEVSVYKGANIDRKHFSKIRSNDAYQPTKRTVIALALSLHLNAMETRDLLESAGYSLSHSYVFDIIIEYFIAEKIYDIHTINEALFSYEQPLLGS